MRRTPLINSSLLEGRSDDIDAFKNALDRSGGEFTGSSAYEAEGEIRDYSMAKSEGSRSVIRRIERSIKIELSSYGVDMDKLTVRHSDKNYFDVFYEFK